MPGLLVYGFKPYGDFPENVSERVLAGITPAAGMMRHVCAVRCDAAMVHAVLADIRPKAILGLGQHPRARKLRIERKARNIRDSETGPAPIETDGPVSRPATLRLPDTEITTTAYDAGSYVCNYSMYLAGGFCEWNGGRFGFIHIPRNCDPAVVCRYLDAAVNRIMNSPD